MVEERTKVISGPDSGTLQALKGKISEPKRVVSHKPGTQEQEVTVRLVEEGAGMVGLEDREDNKEWSGIFNHIVKTARVATFLAEELKKRGENVDPRLILNTVLISHAGRRQWDETTWYPGSVKDAEEKARMGDQPLATKILKKAGIPERIIDTVDAHAVGTLYPIERMDTWEKKIALYCDFRVSQDVMLLEERFADFQKRSIDEPIAQGKPPRLAQEQLDAIKRWAFRTEQEIFSRLPIKSEDISDDSPPQPRWEKYLRRCYINDAEEGIFARLSQLHRQINAGEVGEEQLDREFPPNTWWGKYVRELWKARREEPLHPRVGKQIGIARAIKFYRWLETTDLGGQAKNLPRKPIE